MGDSLSYLDNLLSIPSLGFRVFTKQAITSTTALNLSGQSGGEGPNLEANTTFTGTDSLFIQSEINSSHQSLSGVRSTTQTQEATQSHGLFIFATLNNYR